MPRVDPTPGLLQIAERAATALVASDTAPLLELKAAFLNEVEDELREFEEYVLKADDRDRRRPSIVRWRTIDMDQVDGALVRWIAGDEDALLDATAGGDLKRTAQHIKAQQTNGRLRMSLRKPLKTANDVFSGVLADTFRVPSPAFERLELARHICDLRSQLALRAATGLSSSAPLRSVRSKNHAAVVVRRLEVLDSPTAALSPYDALGIAEGAVLEEGPPIVCMPQDGLSFAFERALTLTQSQAAEWKETYRRSSLLEETYASTTLGINLLRALALYGLSQASKNELLKVLAPADPFLEGPGRAATRLALGDRTYVGHGPKEDAYEAWLWSIAIRLAGVADQEHVWLEEWAGQTDRLSGSIEGRAVVAAAAVLRQVSNEHTALIRAVAEAAPHWLGVSMEDVRNGLIVPEDLQINRDAVTLLLKTVEGDDRLVALLEEGLQKHVW
ncbi:MAG: hypothetical protein AAF938_18125 [Myxococcota bacterium]